MSLSKTVCAVVCYAVIGVFAHGQEMKDSVRLSEVNVIGQRRQIDEVVTVQRLSGEELSRMNSLNVADALRYFSGVQVKDYGGVGGIKTINVRSMGTNHTAVSYDGVMLGNAQNGQIDLGQFSLDNVEVISLYNGQKADVLQSARDFGSAASVYIKTRVPEFKSGETYHARATFKTGSFDLINPSTLVELKLSESVSAQLSAEWINSSGKYKFRYRRVNPAGELAYDTTATRNNGDINATRLELNFNGMLDSGKWSVKGYNYNSERGVPGAIVNNVWRRGERIWDTNSFLQGSFEKQLGKFAILSNAKYAFYRTHYVNNDDKLIKVDNLYRQREIYGSIVAMMNITKRLQMSVGYDLQWNNLKADMYDFAEPTRFTHFASVAAALNLNRLKVRGSMVATFVNDKLDGKESPSDKSSYTPALYASVYPFRTRDFTLRAFVKRSFRMPTFNDLYYADMGNSKLNPERVTQYNVGAMFERTRKRLFSRCSFSIDAYYNKVKDKIVAYPKGQQFRWTMLNLGVVDIKGIDVMALTTISPTEDIDLTLRAQYTYQRAIDVTNPSDNYYKDQIPYIPHHSGSAVLNLRWKQWYADYSYIYVGERYNQQENIRYNYTQPWYTSDISLSRDFTINKVSMKARIEVNNLFSQDYDVILNYPMPKRNYRFTLQVEI